VTPAAQPPADRPREPEELDAKHPLARSTLREYMQELALDPAGIAARRRAVALAQREALRVAHGLLQIGRTDTTRRRFAARLVDQPAMAGGWLRDLVSELRP
jgi:hypothetical protein